MSEASVRVRVGLFLNVGLGLAVPFVGWGEGTAPAWIRSLACLCAIMAATTFVAGRGPRAWWSAFTCLWADVVLYFILYAANERAISAGSIQPNDLQFLYAASFAAAIFTMGFVSTPEIQTRFAVREPSGSKG